MKANVRNKRRNLYRILVVFTDIETRTSLCIELIVSCNECIGEHLSDVVDEQKECGFLCWCASVARTTRAVKSSLVADAYGESIVTFRVSTDLAEFSASFHRAIPSDNVVVTDTLLVFSVASRPLSFRHCKVTTIYTFLQYFQIHRQKNSYFVAYRLLKGRGNRQNRSWARSTPHIIGNEPHIIGRVARLVRMNDVQTLGHDF